MFFTSFPVVIPYALIGIERAFSGRVDSTPSGHSPAPAEPES